MSRMPWMLSVQPVHVRASSADQQENARQAAYKQSQELWKSAGIVIRGVITQAINANGGPFAAGPNPGEVDCEYTCRAQSFNIVG